MVSPLGRWGLFALALTAACSGGGGGSGSSARQNSPPVAEITIDASTVSAPASVRFDGSGSRDPDGSVQSYIWDFGDGNAASGAIVNHTYEMAGQ